MSEDTIRKLRELYGITVDMPRPGEKQFVTVKIPDSARVGIKGWGMIDSLLYTKEGSTRKKVGTWIRTSD